MLCKINICKNQLHFLKTDTEEENVTEILLEIKKYLE